MSVTAMNERGRVFPAIVCAYLFTNTGPPPNPSYLLRIHLLIPRVPVLLAAAVSTLTLTVSERKEKELSIPSGLV
jgi:hypothetical protein